MAHVIRFSDQPRFEPIVVATEKAGQPGEGSAVNVPVYPFAERRFGYGGHPFEPHEVKREFWLDSAHKALADVFPVNGFWGCSAEFRACVEALEPGVHQFFLIDVKRPNRKPIARLDGREVGPGQFFLLNCLQMVDAVLPERSSGPLLKMTEHGFLHFSDERDDLCVSRAMVAGRHLWRARKQGTYGGYYFVSDALMTGLRTAKLKGFGSKPVREG